MLDPITEELRRDAEEYSAAKEDLKRSRVRFEIAKKRIAATKELAREVMGDKEWQQWRAKTDDVKYIGVPIGKAIEQVLRDHAHQCVFMHTHVDPTQAGTVALSLEQIAEVLDKGGFEFRSIAPLREVNAALINLNGIVKVAGNKYQPTDLEDIIVQVEAYIRCQICGEFLLDEAVGRGDTACSRTCAEQLDAQDLWFAQEAKR